MKNNSNLYMNPDNNKYKTWNWKHPFLLHWMINPGLAFNELVLGQRVPKVMFIEKNSSKTLAEKSFIPCPHCNALHSSLKWSAQNKTALKNWFGLYCDNCEQVIPCLWNLTSLLISIITYPFWFLFKKRWKQKWLQIQKEKFSKPLNYSIPEIIWWKSGLEWGLFMFIFLELVFPLFDGSGITLKSILIGIPVWIVGGLLFGLAAKQIAGSRKTRKNDTTNAQQTTL